MRALKSACAVAVLVCGFCLALPGMAGAFATIEAPPTPSPSSELPDGRVYELVSPANKHGNQAGAAVRFESQVDAHAAVAAANGNAVAYGGSGPAGEINASGLSNEFVAERTITGWKNRSVAARILGLNEATAVLQDGLNWPDFSPDLKHVAYIIWRASAAGAPFRSDANIYLMGSDPLAEPTWLLRSVSSSVTEREEHSAILGMTPDASVVYFAYPKHLLPQDATRSGWGIYASRDGQVSEVGVLPNGSVPATGAYPVGSPVEWKQPKEVNPVPIDEINPASSDNQISEDGRRLFFFSGGQLYVHELETDGSERSVLVSSSQLPGHVGEEAPDGVTLFENRTKWNKGYDEFVQVPSSPTAAYASPDGSHVVFQSVDQLTSSAPSDNALKVYDYDVDANSLEYLPGVSLGGVVTSAKDGSSFVFVDGSATEPELDLWTAGPGGGSVRQITQLPEGGYVGPGRMVAGDSVIVFQAKGPIPGVAHSADEQIYRYDVDSNGLSCVSCPPSGTLRSGNAYLSLQDQYEEMGIPSGIPVNDARGVSADGKQIFFATPNPLVTRDTDGDFDTYEWENGKVFLISSGASPNYSPFLDNSESGGDVFFTTTDELVEGDNDRGFDVYDARIPRPGDNPPPAAVPCSGDVCQGPPSVAQLLGAPPSATFNGAGNVVEEPAVAKVQGTSRASDRAHKLTAALRVCRKHRQKSKRLACEKRERRRYATSSTVVKHNGGRGE